jgi:hypothetical protein
MLHFVELHHHNDNDKCLPAIAAMRRYRAFCVAVQAANFATPSPLDFASLTLQ